MAAYYTFEDLSGANTPVTGDNPYQDLIAASHDDQTQIQARYDTHRTNRNNQQRARILSPDFPGVTVDEILAKLEDPSIERGFADWRHCLVFWARPPESVRSLIALIQEELRAVVPNLWIMPPMNLHMTALEITHSLTAAEIDRLVDQMQANIPEIAEYTNSHRARLVKPIVSFDAQALALSFLPAAGEAGRSEHDDSYTYHHLRRDLFDQVSTTGVKVSSRYVIPSAHLTVGRFIEKEDFEIDGEVDHKKVKKLVTAIDTINDWLQTEYWPTESSIKDGGEWIVGQEKGLHCRKGTLWYGGGGENVYAADGFRSL